MAGWMKWLLAIALSIGVGFGLAVWVLDMHPLGGMAGAMERADACRERTQYQNVPESTCSDAYRRDADSIDSQERWIALGSGAAGGGLVLLLAYLLYLRPRKLAASSGQP